jgi:DDE superfamily endonuclease
LLLLPTVFLAPKKDKESLLSHLKKPKNGKLTVEQKQQNKEFSSERVLVEHRIRSVKIFRVVQERFRLKAQKYEQVILTVCELVRLRIRPLILPNLINLPVFG